MKKMRVYVDTSVIGGCFDEEFANPSRSLMQLAGEGRLVLLLSDVLAEELEAAPEFVRRVVAELPPEHVERLARTPEALRLRDAYLAAGVVTRPHAADAMHVALATVAGADLVVSWNFRHFVHYDKIRQFNAVNLRQGYRLIDIRSPQEVI